MVSILEDIKSLYNLLNDEHGNINDVKAKLQHLDKEHGVDKKFIKTVFKTFAIERMVIAVMEELNHKS